MDEEIIQTIKEQVSVLVRVLTSNYPEIDEQEIWEVIEEAAVNQQQ